jgi:tRNA pseudouridine38-40 synthase
MNWKLTLSYDGTHFHGWQVQPGLATVQAALVATVKRVTGETVLPHGSGRTDAGVHALGQVASFPLQVSIPAENLHRALNRALPPSIRILRTEFVGDGFHARFSARSKTYEYRIHERREPLDARRREGGGERICSPFEAQYMWDCRWPLSLEAMQTAAKDLVGTHDFTSFAATDPDLAHRVAGHALNPVRTITECDLQRDGERIVCRITGSGFLHHMVRNIVGTLGDVGRGALSYDCLPRILAAADRSAAGPTAPAQGLFLHSVRYE